VSGRSFYIETYGCQMNVADSELMAGILSEAGHWPADDPADADIILVNTCAIRESPEDKVIQRMAQLAQRKHLRPDLVLGITGCVPKHVGAPMAARLPDVDLVVGPDSYRRLPELIANAVAGPQVDLRMDPDETYDGALPVRAGGVNAWITVMRGCDRFCTFCVVPYVRGREKCVSPGRILDEAAAAVAQGCRSVTLLGQTVNSYRFGDVGFAELLRRVARIPGLARVRYTSPHPADFTGEVFDAMADEPPLCPHLHLPVQSGSDTVLRRMRRGYTKGEFLGLVETIRRRLPGVSLTTDVIVGSPGESEDDFQETLRLMEEIRFDSAFMFKYSPRPKTWAWKNQEDDVAEDEKGRRLREMIDLQERISGEIYRSRVGGVVEVLVEGPSRRDPSRLQGKTADFKTVVFTTSARTADAGDLVEVDILEATSHTLRGRLVLRGSLSLRP
jgi:tRNA-2-methylthio-N6-dimethylallyladenosine synthase